MKDTEASYHNEPILSNGLDYFVPSLNLGAFVDLLTLQIAAAADGALDDPIFNGKGKKRALPESPSSQKQPSKRPKTSGTSSSKSDGPQPASHEWRTVTDDDFGNLTIQAVPKDMECTLVFRHVYEARYTEAAFHPGRTEAEHLTAGGGAMLLDKEVFERFVYTLHESFEENQKFDLGNLNFAVGEERLVACSDVLAAVSSSDLLPRALLQVPEFKFDDIDAEAHDFPADSVDVMAACAILMTAGRVKLDGRLHFTSLPRDNRSGGLLPFKLQIELNVSLITPAIYEPPLSRDTKTARRIEDAQRRFLQYVYPPDTTPSTFDGAVNIPYFYSILGPAPALSPSVDDDALQSPLLVPTLLPFQRRSVAWLLDREGMTIDASSGTVVPKTESADFTFWTRVEEGNQTWYLHRLTGYLSPTAPEEEPALGGILAEEPGLGKTLETIALVLLNPAPEERNPTMTRWDPEAKLDVRAIKATLIVTPPPLASQWVDELKAHAPSLKVLVYDGWSKVKVPITRSQVEEERKRRIKEKKKKKKDAALKKSLAKALEWTGDGDYESDWDSDLDSDMDEDIPVEEEDKEEEIVDWCTYVHGFDVVITTYTTLRNDLNVARAAPTRPRREDVVYSNVERPRSPLVMVEWNRVVMDEVQMVGGGKTEDMVSLIPRLSSFAVSGTPARTQVSDLMHVLKFLRVNTIMGYPRLWNRLLRPAFADVFADFFQHYAIRTMKSAVANELTIPQQNRFLVSIEMGPVERHVYDHTLETVLAELGLDARGVAASSSWEIDGALLRTSLRRLRGICTHPQVGQLQQQKDKLNKPGVLKSMEDVLQAMRDHNWRNYMDEWKSKIQGLIRVAQLKQHDNADHTRYQRASETLLDAEKEANALVKEMEAVIAEHRAKGEVLKAAAAELRDGRGLDGPARSNREEESPKGKGKQREVSLSLSSDDGSDDGEDANLPRTSAGKEHKDKRSALQQRLRESRVVLHRVKFLQGDVYHVLGAAYADQENAAYEAAESIRRALLKTTEDEAKHGMAQLHVDAAKNDVNANTLTIPVPFLDQGGIRSAEHIEELHEIIENVLNEQSTLLWEWRTRIHALLTQSLSASESDTADGEEYQRTLDDQGEAETYLQAYAALLADRREAMYNERTILAAHDAREKKLRHTRAAIKAAAALDAPVEDIEFHPEHEVLQKELAEKRKDLLTELKGRAVKSVLIDLTNAAARIQRETDPEKMLLRTAISELRELVNDQGNMLNTLEADLALFRKAFNQRILYFRQLQEISDSVAEVVWDTTVNDAIDETNAEQRELDVKINTGRARQRYLTHLTKNKANGNAEEEEECCILCRCEFVRGYITQCAHIFCEACLRAWLLKKDGKACPVCRVPIDMDNLQRFVVNDPESKSAPAKPVNGEFAPKSRRKISYNMIDSKLFREIESMESFGDFGNKIQTLVRHLLYLQQSDPGAKSIVFSAWADSLHILDRALTENGIRCLRIDKATKGEGAAKKFKSDPEILVLLLHGERENAGLNVTCASRVFLLESVVHHGFEIQAIARIDRMGQTRQTEVYCYYAEDTVERNILDLAARQGLSLYTKENSAGTLNVSSFAMESDGKQVDSPAKKRQQKGDFISKLDDMLAILFPHMYEDVEYLLPPSEDVLMDDTSDVFGSSAIASGSGQRAPEAGPSGIASSSSTF